MPKLVVIHDTWRGLTIGTHKEVTLLFLFRFHIDRNGMRKESVFFPLTPKRLIEDKLVWCSRFQSQLWYQYDLIIRSQPRSNNACVFNLGVNQEMIWKYWMEHVIYSSTIQAFKSSPIVLLTFDQLKIELFAILEGDTQWMIISCWGTFSYLSPSKVIERTEMNPSPWISMESFKSMQVLPQQLEGGGKRYVS